MTPQPLQWWYLSFAAEEGFRGAVVVLGHDIASAVARAHALGIVPDHGGEVMGIGPSHDHFGLPTDRLLSKADIGDGCELGELPGFEE